MTREPLMLSDTAMVLLRQYDEAKLNRNVPSLFHIQSELLQEIWLLWRYPDLSLIRHLDWHLTLAADLEADFISWAEQSRIPEQNNGVGRGHWETSLVLLGFCRKLSEAYREALAAHNQTKATP